MCLGFTNEYFNNTYVMVLHASLLERYSVSHSNTPHSNEELFHARYFRSRAINVVQFLQPPASDASSSKRSGHSDTVKSE